MMIAMVFAHVWGILELAVLASLTRTIRVRTALAALAAGLYACPLIAILLQTSWTRLAARLTGKYLFEIVGAASYTLDPFIEEFVKVLPLLILIWMIPSVRRQWSTADCVLIGAASGAGFGMAENLFRLSGAMDRVTPVSGGWEIIQVFSVSSPTVPSLTASLTSWLPAGIAGGNVFSSALTPDHFNVHLEWSALAGLAVALIFLVRSKLSRISGIALWLYVGADHAANNLTLSGQTGMLSSLAAPLNSLRHILCLMPAGALLIAWLLDRHRQQASQAPEFALASELSTTSRVSGILRSAMSRPPRSTLWVGSFVRMRRAFASDSACQPERAKTLRQVVLNLRDRIDRLVSGLEPSVAVDRTKLRSAYSIIRQPKVVMWLLLILPSVAWLVTGGFSQASWLQSAIKTSLGWTLVRVTSVFGLTWMGFQLLRGRRTLSHVRATLFADGAAGASLHLASGGGAFLLGIYTLILAITAGPSGRLISNFHVLEAVASAQLIGTQLAALAALAFFPPVVSSSGPLTTSAESKTPSPKPDSSSDLSQEVSDPGLLRPQGALSLERIFNEQADTAPQRPIGDITPVSQPSEATDAAGIVSDGLGLIEEAWKQAADLADNEVSPLTAGGALVDFGKEVGTHDLTPEQIVQDTAAVETQLFVKSLPILGPAATILDPILHQADLPGIGDVAGDIGRAAASDAQTELPKDEQALEDLLRLAKRGKP
jgi:RsiW-degrading membrane proteinase PrsW (M82 family)